MSAPLLATVLLEKGSALDSRQKLDTSFHTLSLDIPTLLSTSAAFTYSTEKGISCALVPEQGENYYSVSDKLYVKDWI